MRKLRLFNGPDWDHSGGKLFVAAFNQKDAVELVNYPRQGPRVQRQFHRGPHEEVLEPGTMG